VLAAALIALPVAASASEAAPAAVTQAPQTKTSTVSLRQAAAREAVKTAPPYGGYAPGGAVEPEPAVHRVLQVPSWRDRAGRDGSRYGLRAVLGQARPHHFSGEAIAMQTYMTLRRVCALTLVVLLFGAAGARAQTSVGTVEGTVTDEQGAILPGVTATLTGPRGAQTETSDDRGHFRFLAVQPGIYMLKVELGTSFAAQTREVTVGLGKVALADFTMKVASVSEAVEVVGASPTVDVRSSSTETTVSNNMLQMTPLYSSTSTTLMNAAPGVTSSSAYGGQAGIGNALLLDGVDTRDPEGGTAWTFFNQNLIEEIQIGGLGAPAEYGGFTGGVVNTVTKSGGNSFSSLFSMRYTDKGLSSSNISAEQLAANASLGNAAVLKKLKDYTVQMGGPIKTNKAFFFASVQRYSALSDPSGPVANSTDISPRVNVKFTLQPTARDTIILGTQYDNYNVTGRVGYWPSSQATDQQTVKEDAPEWVWNAQYRRSFGTNTLFEGKLTGYDGYYYLDPIDPSPFTYDGGTNTYTGGGGGQYYADRSRNQLQVSLTQYAQKFGSHTFKFGAEIERSHVPASTSRTGPPGSTCISTPACRTIASATGTTCRATTAGRRPTRRISGAPAAPP